MDNTSDFTKKGPFSFLTNKSSKIKKIYEEHSSTNKSFINDLNECNENINTQNKKDEEALMFKEKSPFLFNRTKNNPLISDSDVLSFSSYGKSCQISNGKQINLNEIQKKNNTINSFNTSNFNNNFNSNASIRNGNIKTLMNNYNFKKSHESSGSSSYENSDNNSNEKFCPFTNKYDKVNNLISIEEKKAFSFLNDERSLYQNLKKELSMVKSELSIANSVKFFTI